MGKLKDDLKAVLHEESFSDVRLLGIDGKSVLSSKFLLSVRSPVFRKMLMGDYKESEASQVSLHFPSDLLQRVVHYCYTDEVVTPLEDDNNNDETQKQTTTTKTKKEWNEPTVRAMIRLRGAADFFGLPGLHDATTQIILEIMAKYPSMTCCVLDELSATAEDEQTPLSEIAYGIIRAIPNDALLPQNEEEEDPIGGTGILACSPSILGKVLTSANVGSDEFIIVNCLQKWISSYPTNNKNCKKEEATNPPTKGPFLQDDNDNEDDDDSLRFRVAKQIAERVNLKTIDPTKLATVTASDLFPVERLYEAFRDHALVAQPPPQPNDPDDDENDDVPTNNKYKFVIVQGAGSPEVNGVYAAHGSRDGVPMFTKPGGTWQNVEREVTFRLYRAKNKKSTKYWLDIESADGVYGNHNYKILYLVHVTNEGGGEIPPSNNWKVHDKSDAKEPAPFVVCIRHE